MERPLHADPTRIVLVVAGIFAVASLAILAYEIVPSLLGMQSGAHPGKPPSLEEKEKVLENLNATAEGGAAASSSAPVSQDQLLERQKLLSNLNPDERDGSSSTSTPAQKTQAEPPETDAERLKAYQDDQQQMNLKLKAMQNLNEN